MRLSTTIVQVIIVLGFSLTSYSQIKVFRLTPEQKIQQEKEKACSYFSVPDNFSPNSDGEEDILTISIAQNVTQFSISFYDRIGNEVFRSVDTNFRWNGTDFRTGAMLEIGTYSYLCNYTCSEMEYSIEGFCTLTK